MCARPAPSRAVPCRAGIRAGGVAAALVLTLIGSGAQGHGGVSVERDTCLLTIGPYRMHFTGYQPRVRGGTEFCEDIPAVAETIIVLDYVDQALRPMQISVRIVRNVDIAGKPANDGALDYELPPREYPSGTIRIEHEFAEAGYFVGIVTAVDESGSALESRFPFGVGKDRSGAWLVLALVGLAVVGGGVVAFKRWRAACVA